MTAAVSFKVVSARADPMKFLASITATRANVVVATNRNRPAIRNNLREPGLFPQDMSTSLSKP